MANFRKLRVWQVAQQIAIDAHRVTSRMRGATSAALRDQLLRAAISVPTNIVEGCAHESPREFARYAQYSLSSVSELEGHVQLARDLELISEQDFTTLFNNIVDARMMLYGLLKSLRTKRPRTTGSGQQKTGTGSRARETDDGLKNPGRSSSPLPVTAPPDPR